MVLSESEINQDAISALIRDYDVNIDYDNMLNFGVYGSACACEGQYAIRIDHRLSASTQRKTLLHELGHIVLGHFSESCTLTAEEKEFEAEQFADKFT